MSSVPTEITGRPVVQVESVDELAGDGSKKAPSLIVDVDLPDVKLETATELSSLAPQNLLSVTTATIASFI